MLYTAQISETDGTGFTKAVIRYGMACYKDAGWGAVVIKQGCLKKQTNGRIDASVVYLTTGSHQTEIPAKAYELAHSYDPEKEVVMSIVDSSGREMAITLRASDKLLYSDRREGLEFRQD